MAEKDRARHAFGSSQNLEAAMQSGKVDAFDILFLDGDTDPKVGWVTKDGKPVVMKSTSELKGQVAELKTEIATKVSAEEVETVVTEKVTEKVETVVTERVDTVITEKVETVVNDKVETLVTEKVTEKVAELAETKDYEISHKPDGTLVDYRDKEIRVLCGADVKFELQNSGAGSEPNKYYIGFKAYAPDGAVSFKEDLAEIIADDEMYYFEDNEFAGVDAEGRKYSIVWLPVAVYENDAWRYYGAISKEEHYIGWYYSVQWFDANGKVVASDCIRINLANEECYSSITPFYVNGVVDAKVEEVVETKVETIVETKVDAAIDGKVKDAVDTAKEYTDSKIAEVIEDSYGIIEF